MYVNEQAVKDMLEKVKPAKLVAATKYIDEKEIEKLEECGCLYYGENRVQAFLEKYEQYHGKGHWHFIGTLQKNKVKYIIDKVELIHSVNSYHLIDELEKQAQKHHLKVHILLQVNIAKEESKHGFDVEEMDEVMNYLMQCPSLIVDGLMMMAPNIEPEDTRIYFRQTRELLERLKENYPQYPLQELSMGMSQDYQIALEEGATIVRIGRALFYES
ncbi:YggS family pyridoxal phosphate enzyme [Massilimicrobiota sp. An105]|uniref:YggS family pyridoxal phosphate-dependent enzyme n=1 Tax=Massilimicrobiota sp. An105 TaxID=1965540 RepID=UPI000B3A817D|nr:YggS family pyridoxal phosphate-dependent enzyme [Massilimicrobiota sp. An105]OUQ79242.1 YggS family pyridoxal phosphate enzyme [Massilimicrobiota sp. An105]